MGERRWMCRAAGIVVVVLAVSGCQSAPQMAGGGGPAEVEGKEVESVGFEFGWEVPSSRTARVTRTIRRAGGKERTHRGRYRMRVGGSDEQVRVRVEPTFEGSKGTFEGTNLGRIATAASFAAMPTMVVGPEGGFQKAAGLGRTQKQFLKAAETSADGKLPEATRSTLVTLLGEEVLETRSRQFWASLVGLWTGQSFEIGETYEGDTTAMFALPLVGRRKMALEVDFGVEERVSCSDQPGGEAEAPGCVRATIRSRPDVRKIKPVMQKSVDEIAELEARRQGRKQVPKLEVVDVFVRSDVSLVTRPSDLRPISYREKRTTRMTLRAPDGTQKSYRRVDVRRMTFD